MLLLPTCPAFAGFDVAGLLWLAASIGAVADGSGVVPNGGPCGLTLLLLGNIGNCFLKGSVSLGVPKEIRKYFGVSDTPDKIIPNDLIAIVVIVITIWLFTLCCVLAQCSLTPECSKEAPDGRSRSLCHFAKLDAMDQSALFLNC